jgi:hypothetical protein
MTPSAPDPERAHVAAGGALPISPALTSMLPPKAPRAYAPVDRRVVLVALVAIVLAGQLTVILLVVTMFLFTLGVGTAAPAALTQAISVNPNVIGSASGLYGFSQMAVGALCTALVGLGGDPALSAPLVLAAAGIVAQVSFWIALRRPAGG